MGVMKWLRYKAINRYTNNAKNYTKDREAIMRYITLVFISVLGTYLSLVAIELLSYGIATALMFLIRFFYTKSKSALQ